MKRERLTWTADRAASAPPADPGYGTEDQDHPAHQPDPEHGDYAKGDPDAWAETPKAPPYPQGNPPADPGYDTEDQDHPAHVNPPRVPKEARGLQAAILSMAEAKADKCLKVAKVMLQGRKGVTAQMVEDQAFAMMDWSDQHLADTMTRLGGGFLAEEAPAEVPAPTAQDEMLPPSDETIYMDDDELDALLSEEKTPEVAPEAGKKSEVELLAAQVKALTDEITALKKAAAPKVADQNDPNGPTLAPKPKSDEEAKKPETKDACQAELNPEETALLAEMETKACGEMAGKHSEEAPVPEVEEASMFAQMDEMGNPVALTPEDAILAEVFGGKKAKKSDEDEEPEGEDEGKEPEGKEPEGEEPEEDEKDGGKKAKKSEDEEVPAEEPKPEDKEAKKAAQRPQPRKPSQGVGRVGSMTRQAGSNEVAELSKLWESAPDVSNVFNGSTK